MGWNRWEWLEGLKPETLVEAAVRQLASMIADALADWPPEVELQAGGGGSRFAALFEPGAPRPEPEAFREAVKRARWELERDFDAIDYYERNRLLERECAHERDRLAAEFVGHYILESLYFLRERTDYRVKRPDLLRGLELLEQRLMARLVAN